MTRSEESPARSVAPPGVEAPEISGAEPPDSPVPLDTGHTRGAHFRTLAGKPLVISLASTALIAAFVFATTAAGAAIGLAATAILALAVAGVLYAIASARAEEDFFAAYAEGRELQRTAKGALPRSTPLLRKGDKRYAEQIMNGTLPGGLPGALALYTYERQSSDGEGGTDTDYYRFTVVMHDLPIVAGHLSELHCQRRSGFRFMDSAEDAFRRMRRLELESEALDRRYEIFYGREDSENWMKQLFSPSFIVWLAEQPPRDFAFELSAGRLCVNVKDHHDSAAELDEICEAAAVVARRLAEEASE